MTDELDRLGVTLRPATLDDVDFLTDVVIVATRDQGREPDDFDEADYRTGFASWTRAQVSDASSGSTTFVIEQHGVPVGRLRKVGGGAVTELAGLQLLPSHQGLGIGSALVRSLQVRAQPVTLGVEKDNPRARALYERLGFVPVGEDQQEDRLRWEPTS